MKKRESNLRLVWVIVVTMVYLPLLPLCRWSRPQTAIRKSFTWLIGEGWPT